MQPFLNEFRLLLLIGQLSLALCYFVANKQKLLAVLFDKPLKSNKHNSFLQLIYEYCITIRSAKTTVPSCSIKEVKQSSIERIIFYLYSY